MSKTTTKKKPIKKKFTVEKSDLGLWLFLSYITFGVIYIIWLVAIYNEIKQLTNDKNTSVVPIVLAIIIPFYALVLLYRLSKKVEELAIAKNVALIDDFALSNVIISIFTFGRPITLVILQDAINRINK